MADGFEYRKISEWESLEAENEKLKEALKKCGSMAANLTNGKEQYDGDGYGYILKIVKQALDKDRN